MSHDQPAYGLWLLVVINSAVFIMFACSFFKPATARDWRTPVRGGCPDPAGLSAAVADAADPGDVPHLAGDVRAPGADREAEMRAQFGDVFDCLWSVHRASFHNYFMGQPPIDPDTTKVHLGRFMENHSNIRPP